MYTELKWRRAKIFFFGFVQYMFIHCTRSTWSYVSAKFNDDPEVYKGFTDQFLSYINFSFLLFYGFSILGFGQIGDRISLKVFILTGTFSASIIFGMIGIFLHYEQHNRWLFLFLMTLNGIAQGTAWTGLMAMLNNWFTDYKKPILLGCFAACQNVGNIMGDIYCGQFIGRYNDSLKVPILAAALSLFTISFINIFTLENKPDSKFDEFFPKQDEELIQKDKIYQEEKPLTFIQAIFVPGVIFYALAFGCVKAIYYNLGFWLPKYLISVGQTTDIEWINAQTDVGSIPGGIIICSIGYYWHKRSVVVVPSLWIGCCIMIGINYVQYVAHPLTDYITMVFFTGLFMGGVYNNLCGAIAVELSNNPKLKNNKKSTATVVSIVVGYGALFASSDQLIVPYVVSKFFLYNSFLALLASAFLIPMIVSEVSRKEINKDQNIEL